MLENNFLSSSCYVVIDFLNISFHTLLPLSFQNSILKMKNKRNTNNSTTQRKPLFMFWPESFSSFYQFINTEDIQTYILRLFAFQQKNLREAVEVLSQRNKLSSVQSLSRVRLFATP